jgi:hypothetical protein
LGGCRLGQQDGEEEVGLEFHKLKGTRSAGQGQTFEKGSFVYKQVGFFRGYGARISGQGGVCSVFSSFVYTNKLRI